MTTRTASSAPRLSLRRPLIHLFLLLVSLSFLLPLVLVVSASFTDERSLGLHGYTLIPSTFSTAAYRYLLSDPTTVLRAYGVSVVASLAGSILGLTVMALLAYPLSRPEFRYRRLLSFLVFFTLLFNGGLVSSFIINTRYLHLQDSLWALILPYLIVPFYVLLLRTFFAALPGEILEAARMDGASEWLIFFRIVVPLSTPALATVGLFMLLLFWNDYVLGLLYLNDATKFPLQLLLFNILNNITYLNQASNQIAGGTSAVLPAESARMALAVLATGPVAFAFLFVQRYFVNGITVGSLKG